MAGGENSMVAKLAAEFIGTFMLVFTVGCNVLTGQPVWGGVSIACVLMVMIYALGKTSGASFNPAVSLALALHKDLSWAEFGMYSGIELAGGIAAGFAYVGMLGEAFNLAPVGDHSAFQACLAEVLYTFMLCFVVLNVACSKANAGNEFYGLAIGFVITAGAYSGGNVSGGCYNPAVAFGIDVSSFHMGFGYCLVYTVAELIGAAIAYGLFITCRPEEASGAPEGEDTREVPEYSAVQKMLSEFLGTYFLVLTVGLNVLGGSQAAVFSIASALMVMIFALGNCSGAHFNPAVTTAIACLGKCPPADVGMYFVAQFLGGICACGTYMALMHGKTFPLGPGAGYVLSQALIAEFVFTFVLAFVVLSVAAGVKPEHVLTQNFGLAIGSCVTVGGLAIGKISGGSLNPAVSLGIASLGGGYGNCGAYIVTELLAGCAAAGVFMVTHPQDRDEKAADAEAAEKEPIADASAKQEGYDAAA